MREFRPPQRRSGMRLAFALVLGVLLLAGVLPLAKLASGTGQIVYAIGGGTLSIDSGSGMDGQRTIPLALVHEARAVQLHGARRTMGTGAPGYCTGRWSYEDIGPVWQATDCSARAVLIVAAGEDRPIVITPPDPDDFLRRLDARTETTIALPPGNPLLLRALPAAGATILLVSALFVAATMLLGPGRMRYLVGEGRLEVRTIFSRRSWPLAGMRARLRAGGDVKRIAGTAFGGYATGLFRVDGERARVYATELACGVLLEGPARVLVTPEHPQAFLHALQAAGVDVPTSPELGP